LAGFPDPDGAHPVLRKIRRNGAFSAIRAAALRAWGGREIGGRDRMENTPRSTRGAFRALAGTDIGDKNLNIKEKINEIGNIFKICPNAPFDVAQGEGEEGIGGGVFPDPSSRVGAKRRIEGPHPLAQGGFQSLSPAQPV